MDFIDMHVHTTASDGQLSPTEVVDYALSKGLCGVAITDHDTIMGLEDAIAYGKLKGVIIIPGIELSTEFEDEEIHILGYQIDYSNKELLDILKILRDERSHRAIKIIDLLQGLNLDVSFKEVQEIAQEGVIGRPHIAKLMVDKGYVETIHEAFDKYLNKGCPAYVPRYKLSPFEAVDLLKRAGGITVMAHPGLVQRLNLVDDLIKHGIDGIEAYHPDHDSEQNKKFQEMASRHHLLITAGSDFHHPPMALEKRSDLGDVKISLGDIKEFL